MPFLLFNGASWNRVECPILTAKDQAVRRLFKDRSLSIHFSNLGTIVTVAFTHAKTQVMRIPCRAIDASHA